MTKTSVWKAWWGNLAKGKFQGRLQDKVRLLARAALPIVLFQALLWTWSLTAEKKLDTLQTNLVAKATNAFYFEGEPREVFFRRRTRLANQAIGEAARWSNAWRRRFNNWAQHLQRHPQCWVAKLLHTRDLTWLQHRRAQWTSTVGWSIFAGRTDTRASPGAPSRRYQQGLEDLKLMI